MIFTFLQEPWTQAIPTLSTGFSACTLSLSSSWSERSEDCQLPLGTCRFSHRWHPQPCCRPSAGRLAGPPPFSHLHSSLSLFGESQSHTQSLAEPIFPESADTVQIIRWTRRLSLFDSPGHNNSWRQQGRQLWGCLVFVHSPAPSSSASGIGASAVFTVLINLYIQQRKHSHLLDK